VKEGRRHRLFELTAAACLLWLAFYAAWLWLGPSSPHARTVFGDTAYLVPIVAAAGASALAWRSGGRHVRLFWALLALSNVLWLAAELLWSVRELTTDGVPFPWWTDAGYLASDALLLPALIAVARPPRRAIEREALLDAALVVGSLAFVWWWLVLRPLPLALDRASLVGLAYPTLGLLILGLVVALRLLPARRGGLPVQLVIAGLAATAVTDGLYTAAAVNHNYLSGDWLDLGWQLEAVLLTLGGVAAVLGLGEPRNGVLRRPLRLAPAVLVGAVLALVVGSLSVAGARGRIAPSFAVLACSLGALAALRGWRLLAASSSAVSLLEPSTGAYRADYFHDQLRRRSMHLRYYGEQFALALVRVDDRGSTEKRTATQIARSLVSACRALDAVCHLGEATFGIILSGSSQEQAVALGERLRVAVSQAASPTTASVGVVAALEGEQPDHVLGRAETALNAASGLGGNQVRGGPDDLILSGEGRLDEERLELLLAFARTIDQRESAFEEARLIADIAAQLARKLALAPAAVSRTYLAGLLHDLGKVALPEQLLRKPGPLDEDEWKAVFAHALHGAELASKIGLLREAADAIAAHHERWDGSGYPRQLAGERIPIEARIVAVADAFVSMRSGRTYRHGLSRTAALKEIFLQAGHQFDPAITRALLELDGQGVLEELEPTVAELPETAPGVTPPAGNG
jgi:two-component system cell cycle response regulator